MIKKVITNYNNDYIAGSMSLRGPQKKSLDILDNIISNTNILNEDNNDELQNKIHQMYPIFSDFERKFTSLTFALATGVGKTRLMGTFITYLYLNYNIKNFLVVAPNTTIYNKLATDLGYCESPKYVFKGLGCFNKLPHVITNDDYSSKQMSIYDSDVNVYVYNISKFDKENTKMKAFNENIGMSFYEQLSRLDDLVIIMDESHHYRADKGMKAINNLNPVLGLELTATPLVNINNKQIPFKNVVFEYSLSEAIKDGYTRVPFAVTRTNIDFYNFGDEDLDKLMINDGIKCHKQIKEKLINYARSNNLQTIKPFMMIVCKDINHAKKVESYIKSDNFENGFYRYKTIVVNSKQKKSEADEYTKLLLDVENPDNLVEIVIHVNMLKEGWDVNNLYTIVPLRTATSKILREQMVGRGLRLPYGKRTDDKWIDSVMLTAHDKFNEIIEEAQKGNSIFNVGNVIKAEEIEDEKQVTTQIAIDFFDDPKIANLVGIEDDEKVAFTKKINEAFIKSVEDLIQTRSDEELNNKMIENIIKETKESLSSSSDLGRVYEQNYNPIEYYIKENAETAYNKVKEKCILIPKIKTEREYGEYYFDKFDLDLNKFNQKPIENEILMRSLIDSSDEQLIDGGYINYDDVIPEKVLVELIRSKAEVDYQRDNEIIFHLVNTLINFFKEKYGLDGTKNIIMMYKKEISNEIFSQMINHFVRDEGLIKEEVIPGNRVNLKSDYSYNLEKNIFDSYNSDNDGRITSILFTGLKNCVFNSSKFDSEPELILARHLERETDFAKLWLRPNINEFNITYDNGKKYEPDFVVETSDIIYLVEVKADNKMADSDVIAKKKKSIEYCKMVSDWADNVKTKKWKYVLIPASKITESTTFKHLCEQFLCE